MIHLGWLDWQILLLAALSSWLAWSLLKDLNAHRWPTLTSIERKIPRKVLRFTLIFALAFNLVMVITTLIWNYTP